MSADADFVFVCPACGERLSVNGAMREALIENGCVVCGTALSASAFSRNGDGSSSG